ncbi:hypothetical protein NVP1015O_37 [Vibrio phage 1.015.O._10N.222.51.E5]|nr:hypothetical protein NVP1015O_37 [Vibrio phage 1.015.O._10N.222.51.E5]AUR83401.1 hypothetical protein NVP1034O_38 [Vibrio phage 1.034.O._10N.261.46.B7]AUR83469.1 hypothetical protein NVP1034X_39 [Vibrio phage 1.034.X._10N.261.46.B7]AUR90207.1 hypothetical protein NVP1139A_39 [Vibrio phage 1.139.A._10N.261.48.C6]AUR90274.1 hypothetical protein NVP1139B_39 [Vibrio phage 1.139.B._10N.261.48.C6]AUR95595.1 hypothetical protein NVP1209O_38 [Vibrio phage 1.209.O._10N.222.52.B2]
MSKEQLLCCGTTCDKHKVTAEIRELLSALEESHRELCAIAVKCDQGQATLNHRCRIASIIAKHKG